MVLGIISIPLCYIGFIPGILAIVFGSGAKKEIDASAGRQGGRGMATAGVVTGIVGTLWLVVLGIVVLTTFLGQSASSRFEPICNDYDDYSYNDC